MSLTQSYTAGKQAIAAGPSWLLSAGLPALNHRGRQPGWIKFTYPATSRVCAHVLWEDQADHEYFPLWKDIRAGRLSLSLCFLEAVWRSLCGSDIFRTYPSRWSNFHFFLGLWARPLYSIMWQVCLKNTSSSMMDSGVICLTCTLALYLVVSLGYINGHLQCYLLQGSLCSEWVPFSLHNLRLRRELSV